MKNSLMFVGSVVGAAAAAYLVSLYMKDDDIHQKVDRSVADIKNLLSSLRQKMEQEKIARSYKEQSATVRNQQWADQQWEALGI